MAKPKLPNIKKSYKELDERLSKYMANIESLYNDLAKTASATVILSRYVGGEVFKFSSFPEITKRASNMMTEYANSMQAIIMSGTSDEWKRSNELQDEIAKKAIKFYDAQVNGVKQRVYYQTNSEALRAFQERTISGMNLSDRIWDLTQDTQRELEGAISVAIEKGMSAVTLSKRVSKYLNDFDTLKKDYTEKFGSATDIKDCEYRSIRLARSEINMAYRKAENERWQQFDFILGYEVKTSDAHPMDDMCNELAGQYPKDFIFLGWHPNCMCYAVPIVMGEKEYWEMEDLEQEDYEPEGVIEDVPDGFKEWVLKNEESIERAEERGTLPYFLSDNWADVKGISTSSVVRDLMERAEMMGGEMSLITEEVLGEFSGISSGVNFKTFSSAMEDAQELKLLGGTPFDIKDFLSSTIVVDKKEIEAVVKELQKLQEFESLEKKTASCFLGYTGNFVNLNINDVAAQIKVSSPKMVYASENKTNAIKILGKKRYEEIKKETGFEAGLGKKYYEQIRKTKPGTKNWQSLVEKAKKYYSNFT